MTSALNSGVNDRRCRRRAPFPSTCFPIRTPSSWAHAHIWAVRPFGASPHFSGGGTGKIYGGARKGNESAFLVTRIP